MSEDSQIMAELGKLNMALGRIEGTLEGVSDHLATLNGSVARHEKRLNLLESAREFAKGRLAAWRWVPPIITAILGGAVGSLILIVLGGMHG